MKRSASAVWQGGLKDGKGTVSSESGALTNKPYNFRMRFEDEKQLRDVPMLATKKLEVTRYRRRRRLPKFFVDGHDDEPLPVRSVRSVSNLGLPLRRRRPVLRPHRSRGRTMAAPTCPQIHGGSADTRLARTRTFP